MQHQVNASGATGRGVDAIALGIQHAGVHLHPRVLGLQRFGVAPMGGSALAVQTEFVHLLDVGNEAYAASGANVRFRFVAFHETNYAIGPNKDNDVALNDIRINNLPDLDLHAARDAAGADVLAGVGATPAAD